MPILEMSLKGYVLEIIESHQHGVKTDCDSESRVLASETGGPDHRDYIYIHIGSSHSVFIGHTCIFRIFVIPSRPKRRILAQNQVRVRTSYVFQVVLTVVT